MSAEGTSTASGLAKWLVPSVGVLFAIIGYITQTAQESLLGLGSIGSDTTRYILSAGDFLQGVIGALMSAFAYLGDRYSLPLGDHGAWLIFLSLAAIVTVLLAKLGPKFPMLHPVIGHTISLYAILLLVTVALKFVYLDAPLSQLNDVVLESSGKSQSLDVETFGDTFCGRLSGDGKGQRGWFENIVDVHAVKLYAELLGERLGPDNLQSSGPAARLSCPVVTKSDGTRAIAGEFLAHLWTMFLIASLATGLLRSSMASPFQKSLALLSLIYLLTVPYAYGKLIKSTSFDYGRVRLAEPLATADGMLSPDDKLQKPLYGLVISTDSGSTDLLVVRTGKCSMTLQPYQAVKKSILSSEQVLSIEEIYRRDVITWAALYTDLCRAGPAP